MLCLFSKAEALNNSKDCQPLQFPNTRSTPLATISQRSLAQMMVLAGQFGCSQATVCDGPELVSPTEMRRRLFSLGFSVYLLHEFDRMGWNFDEILPMLQTGEYGLNPTRYNRRATRELIHRKRAAAQSVLTELARAFLLIARDINQSSPVGSLVVWDGLYESLRKDGFVWAGDKLVPEEQVIDIPAQRTEFERALNDSKHDNKEVVLHHLEEAESHQAHERWGAASSEWRHVFEDSLRGAWRFTRMKNLELSDRIEKPPFKDVLEWLEQVGFMGAEEKAAFGAGFGFLSIGSHPGIKEKQLAYLSRTLALPLAHACLTKLRSWNGRSFT